MEWFFDGLGTMLLGLVLGGAAGGQLDTALEPGAFAKGSLPATSRVKPKSVGTHPRMIGQRRQDQKAGDNSQQWQVTGDVTIFQGVTEDRAREIARETAAEAVDRYVTEAVTCRRTDSPFRRLDDP